LILLFIKDQNIFIIMQISHLFLLFSPDGTSYFGFVHSQMLFNKTFKLEEVMIGALAEFVDLYRNTIVIFC
jgi:hypothetical protein